MPDLDPEIRDVLHLINLAIKTPLHQLDAIQMRQTFQSLRRPAENLPPMHRIVDQQIPAAHGSLPVRIYRPTADARLPALVWFHGGGWVLGDLDAANLPCQEIAAQSGCVVISVDYRLAPEAEFPAAFNDCLAALQWTISESQLLDIDVDRLAVGGDSAGGNLAACVAIAARDANIPLGCQLLIYPVIKDDFNNTSYTDNANDYFLTRNLMKRFWDLYIPSASDRTDIRVSPINAALQQLPPAWLLTAGYDPLRDEGLDYARALQSAGNHSSTRHVPNAIHGFFTMPIGCGARARAAAATFLRETLARH